MGSSSAKVTCSVCVCGCGGVCVCVCLGNLQQNSISCLHLSGLIVLCSISFRQEASHFCLFFYPIPGQSVSIEQRVFTYFPPCFNSPWQSFKFGSSNLLKGKWHVKTELNIISKPPPNHHCCRCRRRHRCCLHPTKREAGRQGFTNFKFCCWLSGKNNPLGPCSA